MMKIVEASITVKLHEDGTASVSRADSAFIAAVSALINKVPLRFEEDHIVVSEIPPLFHHNLNRYHRLKDD